MIYVWLQTSDISRRHPARSLLSYANLEFFFQVEHTITQPVTSSVQTADGIFALTSDGDFGKLNLDVNDMWSFEMLSKSRGNLLFLNWTRTSIWLSAFYIRRSDTHYDECGTVTGTTILLEVIGSSISNFFARTLLFFLFLNHRVLNIREQLYVMNLNHIISTLNKFEMKWKKNLCFTWIVGLSRYKFILEKTNL